MLIADEVRLRQVLINLLSNAIKFTDRGSVALAMSYDDDRAMLRVAVTDTGVGISKAAQQRLFQRFAQADSSISRTHGGTGLGLSICKQMIELMHGTIGVDSRAGHGSTFWFEIPVPAGEQASPDASAPLAGAGRILVVDDHPANRELLRALLTPVGHSLDEAADGAEAIEACLRAPYDLILMDVNMPRMDGLLASMGIRASCELNRETPIIGLSASGAVDYERTCLAAGMTDTLAKPINPHALLGAVNTWIGARVEAVPAAATTSARPAG